jgi:hypothetical protein
VCYGVDCFRSGVDGSFMNRMGMVSDWAANHLRIVDLGQNKDGFHRFDNWRNFVIVEY